MDFNELWIHTTDINLGLSDSATDIAEQTPITLEPLQRGKGKCNNLHSNSQLLAFKSMDYSSNLAVFTDPHPRFHIPE